MADLIDCEVHGECEKAFVCSHLAEGGSGQGFNRNDPRDEDPFPDAWCNDCEAIRKAHDGWNDESQRLVTIRLLCSGCYERTRIRNTLTKVTLDDLADLRWKCDTCDEWHTGPCLDFSYAAPIYWSSGNVEGAQRGPLSVDRLPSMFLNEDLCIVDGQHFFVRGIIHLPIIGTAETFRWGVWGSLSEVNFRKLLAIIDDPERAELPPMFSWLSNDIEEYENSLNLKMYAHLGEPGERPRFEIEPTEHLLSQEYYHGIAPERVKEIMRKRLRETR